MSMYVRVPQVWSEIQIIYDMYIYSESPAVELDFWNGFDPRQIL